MKPLEDVRVVELSTMITASLAAMMMAEQGATVTKVEPVDAGDPLRSIGSSRGGVSGLFANCNRGKRSLGIDLKQEEGQALVSRLIGDADVLMHNFRPGVMEGLNLGSDRLREINPRLIYMAISGFGTSGPLAGAPAYDPVIQGHTGMAASQGQQGPAFIRNLMCDKITAYTACQAVTGALYQREKTGEGQHIDLSMLDAGLFFMYPDAYMNHTLLGEGIAEQPLLADLLYQMTLTRDGGITISAATDRQRQGVVKALGRESLMEDPRFSTLEALVQHMDEYLEILRDDFLQLTTDEAIARLSEQDVPCARCMSLEEALTQPQLAANGSIETQQHPLAGPMRVLRSPPRFGGKPLPLAAPSPAHGEHTEDILSEMAVSADDLSGLRARGVIR